MLFKQVLMLGLTSVTLMSGCFSGERVNKPEKASWRVAEVTPGAYDLESFVVNGVPLDQQLAILPGEKLKVEVSFNRKQRPATQRGVVAYIVAEKRENETNQRGTQVIVKQQGLPTSAGLGKRSIKTELDGIDEQTADFLENHTLGRYIILILAEGDSQISERKIEIVK